MKKGLITFFTVFYLTMMGTAMADDKVVVIVNEANSQMLSTTDLKNMYNDIVIHWTNNQPIDLYDIPVAAQARKIFSEKVLGVSPSEAARD